MNQILIHERRAKALLTESCFDQYLTAFVAGTFTLTAVTGIAKQFTVFGEELGSIHICMGGLLVLGVVGRVLWYWPRVARAVALVSYQVRVLALLFFAVVSWLATYGEDSGHHRTLEMLSQTACHASVSSLVRVAGVPPESVAKRLQDQGMVFESWQQSPEEIAVQNGRDAMEVVAIILEESSANRST